MVNIELTEDQAKLLQSLIESHPTYKWDDELGKKVKRIRFIVKVASRQNLLKNKW